jgi:hypothetical protein
LINSCVSSELRNPLNSLVAFNSLKRKMIERLELVVSSSVSNEQGNLFVPADLRLKILRE